MKNLKPVDHLKFWTTATKIIVPIWLIIVAIIIFILYHFISKWW